MEKIQEVSKDRIFLELMMIGFVECLGTTKIYTQEKQMNLAKIFPFGGTSIRTVSNDTEVRFIAKDVAETLGYKDTKKAIQLHCRNTQAFDEFIRGGDLPPLAESLNLGLKGVKAKVIADFNNIINSLERMGNMRGVYEVETWNHSTGKIIAELKQKIADIQDEKIMEFKRIMEQYEIAKTQFANEKEYAIKETDSKYSYDIKVRKQRVDDYYAKQNKMQEEYTSGRITYDELIAFLAEEFNPNDMPFQEKPINDGSDDDEDIKF